jgi:hypothetical protein
MNFFRTDKAEKLFWIFVLFSFISPQPSAIAFFGALLFGLCHFTILLSDLLRNNSPQKDSDKESISESAEAVQEYTQDYKIIGFLLFLITWACFLYQFFGDGSLDTLSYRTALVCLIARIILYILSFIKFKRGKTNL